MNEQHCMYPTLVDDGPCARCGRLEHFPFHGDERWPDPARGFVPRVLRLCGHIESVHVEDSPGIFDCGGCWDAGALTEFDSEPWVHPFTPAPVSEAVTGGQS